MTKYSITIIITVLISTLGFSQNAKDIYLDALKEFDATNYESAARKAEQAKSLLNSTNPRIESLLMVSYFYSNEIIKAQISYKTLLKITPQSKIKDPSFNYYLKIGEEIESALLNLQKKYEADRSELAVQRMNEANKIAQELDANAQKKITESYENSAEEKIYRKVKESNNIDDYEVFLKEYPNSKYKDEISKNIAEIEKSNDIKAYALAEEDNSIEGYNKYLNNPKHQIYRVKAQEKLDYLLFAKIVEMDGPDKALEFYLRLAPNSKYIDRLKLMVKYQDVRDLKISSHKNGDNFVQSGNRYIHGLDAIQALKVLENAINLEVLEIGYYELNTDVIVDLSLLKNLKRITLQRAVPHLIFNAADKLDNVKTLYIDSYKSSNSSLKHFKGLTSIESLHLGHINKSNRNDILELLDNNERLVNVSFKHFEIETGSRDKTYDNHMDAVLQKLCKQKYLRKLEIINVINRIPENFGGLLLLEELDLWGNRLKELPNSFGTFKNLRILHLAYNDFEVLPDVISNLENLEILDLGKNYSLSKLPSDFGRLKKLRSLNLAWTRVDVLPQSFLELESLTRLDIYEAMDGDDKKKGKRILKEFQKQHKTLVVVDKFKEHHSEENKAVFIYI